MFKPPVIPCRTFQGGGSDVVSAACFCVRVLVMFHLMFFFIIVLVRSGLMSGQLFGTSCPLSWPFVLIVFKICLSVIFFYFLFWF